VPPFFGYPSLAVAQKHTHDRMVTAKETEVTMTAKKKRNGVSFSKFFWDSFRFVAGE
jgi:hypothetical protein